MTQTPTTEEDQEYLLEPLDSEATDTEDQDEGATDSLAMFEGDTSRLFEDQRRCLHAVLKQRYLSGERHPELWAVLVANQDLIRSRLNELFFELYLDDTHQIAFKRQARTESGESLPSLLRDVSHTKEETIVMLVLRQRFHAQQQEGENFVFVERQALLDEIAELRPDHATDRVADQKHSTKAIESLATTGVLLKTADPDRFRISPIIEVLLPVEKLRALQSWFMAQNNTAPVSDETDETDVETDTEPLDLLVDLEEDDA
ncbi:DUF4194 domain-containing protein [Nesterenkonia halotolerans]|uniref:DUF4194 domain-containing protein n=1 Tax=Nesterenkonia halotolerans TaxID=225325 RepID=UPI003EE7A414